MESRFDNMRGLNWTLNISISLESYLEKAGFKPEMENSRLPKYIKTLLFVDSDLSVGEGVFFK